MPNKPIIPVVVFFFMCVPVFSQTQTDNFIEGFYWYWKYLPQEHISEYYTLEKALAYLKENDTSAFEKLSMDLSEPVRYLNDRVHENLREERRRVSPKIETLMERHKANEEVIALAEQFAAFEDAIAKKDFPDDDSCLSKIDKLYSRLITRLGYAFLNNRTPYLVKRGDYLRKIAAIFYENELLWEPIYNENINNRSFLPNPQNPDLIYPEARIQIPPKPPKPE